jgi:hypothetical protein
MTLTILLVKNVLSLLVLAKAVYYWLFHILITVKPQELLAHAAQPARKVKYMKNNDLRPEYSRKTLGKGVRGKFLKSYEKGTNIVLLNPEIAKVFSSSAAVNEALCSLLQITKQTTRLTRPSSDTR